MNHLLPIIWYGLLADMISPVIIGGIFLFMLVLVALFVLLIIWIFLKIRKKKQQKTNLNDGSECNK
jgi:membrane protein implicated in regulation of membrane protease activity